MPKDPIEHRFLIDGEPFCLRDCTHAGEREIQRRYALAISEAPDILNGLYGEDIYAEAVAQVCLVEAPAWCWREHPPTTPTNGTPKRVLDLSDTPRPFWYALRTEIDVFLRRVVRGEESSPAPDSPGVPGDAVPVAPPQTVSPQLRGVAG